jgi:hypothetical protein
MEKQILDRAKRIMSILLLVFFVISVTGVASTAKADNMFTAKICYQIGCNDAKNSRNSDPPSGCPYKWAYYKGYYDCGS